MVDLFHNMHCRVQPLPSSSPTEASENTGPHESSRCHAPSSVPRGHTHGLSRGAITIMRYTQVGSLQGLVLSSEGAWEWVTVGGQGV